MEEDGPHDWFDEDRKLKTLLIRLGLKHLDSGLEIMGYEDAQGRTSRAQRKRRIRGRRIACRT